MPARSRSVKYANGNVTPDHEREYTLQPVGLYGWRKKCLYLLILLIVAIATINLTMIVWIIRVQNFSFNGMGKLHITSNGIRMEGVAEFVAALRAKQIVSTQGGSLSINSRRNISLSALDENNNVLGQLTLTGNQIILKNKQLLIQDHNGRTVMHADDKSMTINTDNMELKVPGGLNFENSVQTPLVSSSDRSKDLRLEALTKKMYIHAANGVSISSHANDIVFSSLKDTRILSNKGKIIFDATNIRLRNVKQSSVPDIEVPSTGDGTVYGGIAEVCMCGDGRLFLAPPDVQKPCKVTAGVC